MRGVESSRSSSIRTPALVHFSTMALCQSDSGPSNQSRTEAAIVGPTCSAAAMSASEAARIASIKQPNSAARARAAVGPTCRIERAAHHAPQRDVLGLVEVLEQLLAVRGQLWSVLALLRRPGEQVPCIPGRRGRGRTRRPRPQFIRPSRARRPPRSPVPRCRRRPAGHVEDPVEQLRRAGGDWGAGLAEDHGVAGPDVLALDLVGVVQGGALDGRAGNLDRLDHAERWPRPVRPVFTSIKREDSALTSSGGYSERDRPARRAAGRAEPALEGDVVDLHHDAVDLVGHDRVPV